MRLRTLTLQGPGVHSMLAGDCPAGARQPKKKNGAEKGKASSLFRSEGLPAIEAQKRGVRAQDRAIGQAEAGTAGNRDPTVFLVSEP